MSDFGFYFEAAGLNAVQGPTSSAEEHFKEVGMAEALVREMGQNSLDAKDSENTGPVRMQFEVRTMNVGEVPGFDELHRHIVAADKATRHIDASNDRLSVAAQGARAAQLSVLRIGDYGTTGLTGREDDDSNTSPLVALTRAKGISAGKVGKGGSFGVGASTGALASAIRTVLWTSLPKGEDEVVFAGQSQLATHELDGVRRGPDGFFTDRDVKNNFRYLRSPDPVGPFDRRADQGTDTFILGYLDADEDPQLLRIRDAFIKNFFVAIDRGLLEVEGISDDGQWKLDSKTLGDSILSYPEVFPYYKALRNDPYVEEVPGLGTLKLYMEFDDSLPKKLDTLAMRAPLMRVTTYTHHSIRAKYAAVFLAEAEPANTKLRKLEPPAHDKWVPHRADDGKKIVDKVKTFIRNGLRTQLVEDVGEEIRVAEMEKLLPAGLGESSLDALDVNGKPMDNVTGARESSSVHGKDTPVTAKISQRPSYRVGTHQPAISGGSEAGTAGRRGGGGKHRASTGGDTPTKSEPGDGAAKIVDKEVSMRSWTDAQTGDIMVVLRTDEPATGSLKFAALSEGGAPEKDFTLPIVEVIQDPQANSRTLNFRGNVIDDIQIGDSLSATLRIKLSTADRFRLGII